MSGFFTLMGWKTQVELPGLSFDILMTGYEVIGDEYLIFLDESCGILK